MANILFVVPRFHTNLFFAVRALTGGGHRVTIMAEGATVETPPLNVIHHVVGPDPSRDDLTPILAAAAPDLVFLRRAGQLTRRVSPMVRNCGARILRYDLSPLDTCRPVRRLLKACLRREPLHSVTPVPGLLGHG